MRRSSPGAPAGQHGVLEVVGERAAFFGRQADLDTVVFVHGLRGHYSETWKKFPALLASDPDLPRLDVFLWGYASGLVRRGIFSIEEVGDELISQLSARFQQDNALHLVGHSLGGLVILKGMVSEMLALRAQKPPASRVSFISLFASPVSGSSAAAVLKHTLGWLPRFLGPLSRQFRDVARGSLVDQLLDDVVARIDAPGRTDDSRRAIPIRMIMATRDRVVDETDRKRASARFQKTTPLAFDYDHRTIKEPSDHNDERYRALSQDIQAGLADRFHRICVDLATGTPPAKEAAAREFARRYEHIFRRRLEDHGVDIDPQSGLYRSYLRVIIRDCLGSPRPPFYAADRVLMHMIEAGILVRAR